MAPAAAGGLGKKTMGFSMVDLCEYGKHMGTKHMKMIYHGISMFQCYIYGNIYTLWGIYTRWYIWNIPMI